jgi:predicted metal-dependent peptidase
MSRDKGTVSELPVGNRATEAEAARFELDPHLVRLMWDEPFFSKVLRTVTKVKTNAIPTAGVLAKDGDIKMWWNPAFLAGLTANQVKGLLKHECYHLVFEHTTTRRHDPHIVWNYATDLAINSLIPEDELPDGGLIPGKEFKALSDENRAAMGEDAAKRYEAVSAKIASFEKGWASEVYFAKLMEDPDVREGIEGGNKVKGKSLGQALADGDVKVDADGNLVDRDGNPVELMPGATDDHDGWDKLSEEERELIKGKVKKALEGAIKDCDRTGKWGSISGETRSTLREMVRKDIDWKTLLKSFCGMMRRSDRTSNIRRLNRKYPGIHPGSQKGYTSSIAVYIDQSGSVSDEWLELLFANLRTLAKHTEFVTFHFDTEVDVKSEETWRGGKTPSATRTRCGGTCFKAPTVHANKNKKRFDGFLILTDGCAPDPGPTRLKRGWVITPTCDLAFSPSPRDVVCKMKETA